MSPYNIKRDAECILNFLTNDLKLNSKIGVYGRSLGGIATCHLANNFPEKISAMIVDRSFSELDVSS
jgi:pimeloyl-ACP methyl ester carboxylesterase